MKSPLTIKHRCPNNNDTAKLSKQLQLELPIKYHYRSNPNQSYRYLLNLSNRQSTLVFIEKFISLHRWISLKVIYRILQNIIQIAHCMTNLYFHPMKVLKTKCYKFKYLLKIFTIYLHKYTSLKMILKFLYVIQTKCNSIK